MSKLNSRVDRLERSGNQAHKGVVVYEVDEDAEERSLSAEDQAQLERDRDAGRLIVFIRHWGGTPRGRLYYAGGETYSRDEYERAFGAAPAA